MEGRDQSLVLCMVDLSRLVGICEDMTHRQLYKWASSPVEVLGWR